MSRQLFQTLGPTARMSANVITYSIFKFSALPTVRANSASRCGSCVSRCCAKCDIRRCWRTRNSHWATSSSLSGRRAAIAGIMSAPREEGPHERRIVPLSLTDQVQVLAAQPLRILRDRDAVALRVAEHRHQCRRRAADHLWTVDGERPVHDPYALADLAPGDAADQAIR